MGFPKTKPIQGQQAPNADTTKGPENMNHFQAKQDAKRERLENAADRAEAKANTAYQRADLREEVSGIPLGQPILVGHHSEGRHRRAIERADNAMRQSVEQDKRAGELRARAAGVGTGGINAQDPEAITKLRDKLTGLETTQAQMKAANAVMRTLVKGGITHETTGDAWESAVTLFNTKLSKSYGGEVLRSFLTPKYGRVIAFETFQLTNNNAKIKAAQKRLNELEAMRDRAPVSKEIEGVCTYVENPELARVQLIFEGKPTNEVRSILKGHGFRWAPTENAWQRHLNNNGRYSAKLAIAKLVEAVA